MLGIEATINQHIAYIKPRPDVLLSEYLCLFLTGSYTHLRSISDDSGSTRGALTCEGLKRFPVVVPPRGEQGHIIRFVRDATAEIELAISRANRQVELIREYRTRLITDVVTGKLDVRHLAPDTLEPSSADLEPIDGLDQAGDDDAAGLDEAEASEELIAAGD